MVTLRKLYKYHETKRIKIVSLKTHEKASKMNDQINRTDPEPTKVSVWTEGSRIQAKELIIPVKSPDSSDDIPTLPDIDDFQDILEKEISKPPVSEHKDVETANALAEIGGDLSSSVEGIEAVIEVLRSHVPQVEMDTADSIWTIDTLLTQLADEGSS